MFLCKKYTEKAALLAQPVACSCVVSCAFYAADAMNPQSFVILTTSIWVNIGQKRNLRYWPKIRCKAIARSRRKGVEMSH